MRKGNTPSFTGCQCQQRFPCTSAYMYMYMSNIGITECDLLSNQSLSFVVRERLGNEGIPRNHTCAYTCVPLCSPPTKASLILFRKEEIPHSYTFHSLFPHKLCLKGTCCRTFFNLLQYVQQHIS